MLPLVPNSQRDTQTAWTGPASPASQQPVQVPACMDGHRASGFDVRDLRVNANKIPFLLLMLHYTVTDRFSLQASTCNSSLKGKPGLLINIGYFNFLCAHFCAFLFHSHAVKEDSCCRHEREDAPSLPIGDPVAVGPAKPQPLPRPPQTPAVIHSRGSALPHPPDPVRTVRPGPLFYHQSGSKISMRLAVDCWG